MERKEQLPEEIAFLRSLPERPRFCCEECGSQNYRTIIRGLIPKTGEPFIQEKVRICDPCSDQEVEGRDLTAQSGTGIIIKDR